MSKYNSIYFPCGFLDDSEKVFYFHDDHCCDCGPYYMNKWFYVDQTAHIRDYYNHIGYVESTFQISMAQIGPCIRLSDGSMFDHENKSWDDDLYFTCLEK